MEDETSVWIGDDEGVKNEFVRHFTMMFSSAHPTNMEVVLDAMVSRVTPEMNVQLVR